MFFGVRQEANIRCGCEDEQNQPLANNTIASTSRLLVFRIIVAVSLVFIKRYIIIPFMIQGVEQGTQAGLPERRRAIDAGFQQGLALLRRYGVGNSLFVGPSIDWQPTSSAQHIGFVLQVESDRFVIRVGRRAGVVSRNTTTDNLFDRSYHDGNSFFSSVMTDDEIYESLVERTSERVAIVSPYGSGNEALKEDIKKALKQVDDERIIAIEPYLSRVLVSGLD